MATGQVSDLVSGQKNIKKEANGASNEAPEGVVVAPATQSPGASKAKSTPSAAPPAPANQTARPLPIPKELIIDMIDDLAPTEATGRGKRTRKPKKWFGEDSAPPAPAQRKVRGLPTPKDLIIDMVDDLAPTEATGRGKRIRKPKKFFGEAIVAGPAAASTTLGKRKRAADDNAASTSAVPSAGPPPTLTAPAPKKRGRPPKNQGSANAAAAAPATNPKTGGRKGKGKAKKR
ncbi:hypothetical protein MMC07_009060 [Pseudocyphellaria aurata]|nr:hypothetical protein [Pseudocyphellaria aurata]